MAERTVLSHQGHNRGTKLKKLQAKACNSLILLVAGTGFEPVTFEYEHEIKYSFNNIFKALAGYSVG